MLYLIGWLLFLIFFKAYLKFKVVGRGNVPKEGAFIFAANHSSYLDPIILGISSYRNLNYMARDTLFSRPLFGWVMKQIHSFPVKRHDNDFRAIKESLKKLKEGKPLVIFPEGARSKDENLKKGKPGIGFVAAKTRVPIVPAYIKGSFEAMPGGMDSLKRRPVTIYIGRPIKFNGTTASKEAYQKISDEVMRNIAELKSLAESGSIMELR